MRRILMVAVKLTGDPTYVCKELILSGWEQRSLKKRFANASEVNSYYAYAKRILGERFRRNGFL